MLNRRISKFLFVAFALLIIGLETKSGLAQDSTAKAEAIIKKAVQRMGGEKYLQVKTVVASGNYTAYQKEVATMPAGFVDVIVFPGSERTEFNQSGKKYIQVNSGETGWVYDTTSKAVRDQNATELQAFKRSMRTSLDNFLRGVWRPSGAKLDYLGKREASLGKRNEVVKLTYPDDFVVEFEFAADDGLPAKVIYRNSDAPDAKQEERFAQFLDIQGVYTPFVIDRFVDGKQESRINYINIVFDRDIPPAAFAKPANDKELKKNFKFN